MNATRLKKVKQEMKRLEAAIKELEAEAEPSKYGTYWAPKQTGAVRRASMDLTRALSELRRHN